MEWQNPTALRKRGGGGWPSQRKLAMRMEENLLLKEDRIERWYLASSPRA